MPARVVGSLLPRIADQIAGVPQIRGAGITQRHRGCAPTRTECRPGIAALSRPASVARNVLCRRARSDRSNDQRPPSLAIGHPPVDRSRLARRSRNSDSRTWPMRRQPRGEQFWSQRVAVDEHSAPLTAPEDRASSIHHNPSAADYLQQLLIPARALAACPPPPGPGRSARHAGSPDRPDPSSFTYGAKLVPPTEQTEMPR